MNWIARLINYEALLALFSMTFSYMWTIRIRIQSPIPDYIKAHLMLLCAHLLCIFGENIKEGRKQARNGRRELFAETATFDAFTETSTLGCGPCPAAETLRAAGAWGRHLRRRCIRTRGWRPLQWPPWKPPGQWPASCLCQVEHLIGCSLWGHPILWVHYTVSGIWPFEHLFVLLFCCCSPYAKDVFVKCWPG